MHFSHNQGKLNNKKKEKNQLGSAGHKEDSEESAPNSEVTTCKHPGN